MRTFCWGILDGEETCKEVLIPFDRILCIQDHDGGKGNTCLVSIAIDFCKKVDRIEKCIVPVIQHLCLSADQVLEIHNKLLEEGFEGTMLRSPNGIYKHNRSTAKERDLRKFKPFDTLDAVIIGFQQKERLTEEAKEYITDKDAFGHSKRGSKKGDREAVEEIGAIRAMTEKGVDKIGLVDMDRRYLGILFNNYDGGPAGLQALASNLNTVQETIADSVEPYLMQIGLVGRSSSGRFLTTEGLAYARSLNHPLDQP